LFKIGYGISNESHLERKDIYYLTVSPLPSFRNVSLMTS